MILQLYNEATQKPGLTLNMDKVRMIIPQPEQMFRIVFNQGNLDINHVVFDWILQQFHITADTLEGLHLLNMQAVQAIAPSGKGHVICFEKGQHHISETAYQRIVAATQLFWPDEPDFVSFNDV